MPTTRDDAPVDPEGNERCALATTAALAPGDVAIAMVIRPDTGNAVIRLRGEHDLTCIGQLRSQIDGLTETCVQVELDLEDATFVDSSVLHEIDRLYTKCVLENRTLVVKTSPGSHVHEVLELTGLLDLLARAATSAVESSDI